MYHKEDSKQNNFEYPIGCILNFNIIVWTNERQTLIGSSYQIHTVMQHFIHQFLVLGLLLFSCIPGFSQGKTITLHMEKNKQADVYYESHGEGLSVVILHRASAGYLEPIISEKEGFRRIYIDPPGIGNSGSEDWIKTADDCFAIIDQVIQQILPEGPYAIGGFSYFGYMARAVAEAHPSRINGLLMMCPVTQPDRAKRSLPEHIRTYTDSVFYQSLLPAQQDLLSGLVIKNASSYRAITRYLDTTVTMDRNFWDRIKRNQYGISHLSKPTGVDAPVMLFLGLQDEVVGYTDALPLIERYPSVSLVLADYASHSFPFEQYGLLRQNVQLWLERIRMYNQR